jgi:iron complex outermembrane receptor protein
VNPRGRLLVLLFGLLWSGASVATEPVSIGVMDFVAKGGMSQDKADVLADLLAEEISRMGDVEVITEAEIFSIMKLEKQKRLVGCDTTECISEIGGAYGVRWMVSGNVSMFGETLLLNLKLFDVERMKVASRVSRRFIGGVDMLLSELPKCVHELFAAVGERMGLSMAETVTVAARHPQPLKQSPAATTVITRQDIESSGATTIADLLRMVPGMDVVVDNPFSSGISSRLMWTYENNVYLVLIDGREANFELLGATPFEIQPISLDDIERIEVIRGAASSLYGANAVAGVVSITTRAIPEKASAWVRVAGGEAGQLAAEARGAAMIGEIGLSLSGGAESSGAFADPRAPGKRVWKFRSVAEYRWPDSRRLLLDLGLSEGSGHMSSAIGNIDATLGLRTLRLSYNSERLRGQLYWSWMRADGRVDTPLEYGDILLARFAPAAADGQVVDGEIQWTLPRLWEVLLVILGGGGRFSWLLSGDFLDAETFADRSSPRYHKPGISHWEMRGGAFVHGELSLADWVTITGGLRLDYNTETGEFLSPRLAAVFRLMSGHFVRMGAARAFRKPAFLESGLHLMAEFPDESPLQGDAQDAFQEFMTRVIGNPDLENEHLVSFEAGYLGRFLDGKLNVELNVYYNLYTNRVEFISNIVPDSQGLPDVHRSSNMFDNEGEDLDILGTELSFRFDLSESVYFLASWTHREVVCHDRRDVCLESEEGPRNLLSLGTSFQTDSGLVGSFFTFSRSDFVEPNVENPAGLLQPRLRRDLSSAILFIGKLGWKMIFEEDFVVETGVKVFFPVSPFSAPHFRYYERAGGVTPSGERFGGEPLARVVVGYVQGSY